MTELKVDALSCRFGRHHDLGSFTEVSLFGDALSELESSVNSRDLEFTLEMLDEVFERVPVLSED